MAANNAYNDRYAYHSQQPIHTPYHDESPFPQQQPSSSRTHKQHNPVRESNRPYSGQTTPAEAGANGYDEPSYRDTSPDGAAITSCYPPASSAAPYVDVRGTPQSTLYHRYSPHHNNQLHMPNSHQEPYTSLPSPRSHSHAPILPASPTLSEGIYPDRPIKWDRLNAEQHLIAKTFPKDLDEDGKTMRDSFHQMLRNWRHWIKWTYWYYYIACILLLALVVVFVVLHDKIVTWLTPISAKVNSVPWGWVIPVAILFVISFPPLFGHELIGILCGVVYPFWPAFGIVALGTLLGEWGNFWAFGACLQGLANKYERKNLNYACMAHIVREGGFFIILVARLSAIPGHFTTAVFSTVGMSFWIFTLATLLSMPKQLAVVYVGYAIRTSGNGQESTTAKIIKWVVLVISGIITVAAAWYLYRKMELARPEVQKRLREKRYDLLSDAKETPVRGILLKRGDEDDSFSSMQRTTTGANTERDFDRPLRPREEGGGGDIGIVVDQYSNYDEGDNEYRYTSGSQWSRQGGGSRSDRGNSTAADIQMKHFLPPRSNGGANGTVAVDEYHRQPSMALGVSSQPGIAALSDAGASTEALLSRRQDGTSGSVSPPRTRLHLNHQNGTSDSPDSHQRQPPRPIDESRCSPSRVEPLDMDVLLAATSRNSPSRSGPVQAPRASPPRYETLNWTEQGDGGHTDTSNNHR